MDEHSRQGTGPPGAPTAGEAAPATASLGDPRRPAGFRENGRPPRPGGIAVSPASPDDLPRILEIQKRAFLADCAVLGDWTIEPVVQTLREVEDDFRSSAVLKAVGPAGELMGSIRARRGGEGVYLFKLSVDPALQGRGAARALIGAAEAALPSGRYWLKTRSGNEPASSLYLKLGYSKYKEEEATPALSFTFFEKLVPDGARGGPGGAPSPEAPAGSRARGAGRPSPCTPR